MSPTRYPKCPNSVQSIRRSNPINNHQYGCSSNSTMIISGGSRPTSTNNNNNNNNLNYFVENRFLNNGLTLSNNSPLMNNQQKRDNKDYDNINISKNSLSCR